jgi:HlyD family secretion protein
MKLKPGMTANISIIVDQRDKALRVANAALRYRPPGATVPDLGPDGLPSPLIGAESEAKVYREKSIAPPTQLAPGQKWDPLQKIRFASPKRVIPRPAIVYVLDEQRKPYSKKVVLGITDGSFTEVVRGEINPGDPVIIGDSTQATPTSTLAPPPPFLGPPGFGPGFGPRGGGGRGN